MLIDRKKIGEVVSKEFKGEEVYATIYIYDKYNYLVNKSSNFVMNEALKVSYGASGLNIDTVGKMEFLKARANLKGYDLTAVVCSTLKYEDGTSVYADTTEEDRK